MKNIEEILKNLGIDVPEDKVADLKSAVSDNYKTINEYDKKIARLETERDGYKSQAEDASKTLESFKDVDLDTINKQLADYKKRAEDAENDYKNKLYQRDFDDALREKLNGVKFSSEAAKKSVTAEIRDAGLKLSNGAILGFDDLIKQIKERDASAFGEDDGKPRQKFTEPNKNQNGGKQYSSKEEILKIKDATERQNAIAANMELFT